jgi:DNA-binding transcriptional LysR family regulator
MELRHLRYFVAIAEERSFTRAAERLWIAQPGLSTQIRRLEGELGVKLFERHSRGVDLTRAGELLLKRARLALAAAEAATAIGGDLEAGVIGSVRLGMASGARCSQAVELLQRFARERPGVELSVLEGYAGALWRDLRDGRLDAVIAPAGHASFDLRRLELGSEAWVVLMGIRHRLAGVGPLVAGDLQGERVALTGHPEDAVLDGAVTGLLAEFVVSAEFVSGVPGPALQTAVAESDMVALTTSPTALAAGVIARRLAPRRSLSFELLHRDEAPSAALAGFVGAAAPSSRPLAAVA